MTARILILPLLVCGTALAQRHEIGLTLGRFTPLERAGGGLRLDLGGGTALQANYGFRLIEGRMASLYTEVHFLASPQRLVSSPEVALTRDVASLYAIPGLRLKFLPGSRISPYAVVGVGVAWYEQSTKVLSGALNGAPREAIRGALDFGGGFDLPLWRFIGVRAEVRDFYTGSLAYNTGAIAGGQHNVVLGGGFILKLGRGE